MTDPLSLLPLALAAAGGAVDGVPASQCVAAGLTLLQRSAPLVRALAGRRSAILLPASPHFLTALGASEGRSALLLDGGASDDALHAELATAGVGALFTLAGRGAPLPDMPVVVLDDVPRRAQVRVAGRSWDVDLGMHFPLELHGDPEATGSDEEVAAVLASHASGERRLLPSSHRQLLDRGRQVARRLSLTAQDTVLCLIPWSRPDFLALGGIAPLLAGASVFTLRAGDAGAAVAAIGQRRITALVAEPSQLESMLAAPQLGTACASVRACWTPAAGAADGALQQRWSAATGVPLLLL